MDQNYSEIIDLIKKNKLQKSLELIDELEKNNKKDYNICNLKGYVFLKLFEFNKSIEYLTKAINFNQTNFTTFCYRAYAYIEVGKFKEALLDFKEALTLNPNSHQIYFHLAETYSKLSEGNKMFENYLKCLDIKENFAPAVDNLITKLTEVKCEIDLNNPIIKTHYIINKIDFDYSSSKKIDIDAIKLFFNKSNNLVNQNLKDLKTSQSQIFRSNNKDLKCKRHWNIFKKFEVIPKFCFSCFKVTIELKNVVDLIKLYIIFDNIILPTNNIRKCAIEKRANIKGFYKGLVYCDSLEEAKLIQLKLKKIIEKNIDHNIEPKLQRGCSEFGIRYPDYKITEKKLMAYDENWSKFENIMDQKFPMLNIEKKNLETKKGASLKDILIIKNWLLYAKLIGDVSYKKISEENFDNINIKQMFSQKINSIYKS